MFIAATVARSFRMFCLSEQGVLPSRQQDRDKLKQLAPLPQMDLDGFVWSVDPSALSFASD